MNTGLTQQTTTNKHQQQTKLKR